MEKTTQEVFNDIATRYSAARKVLAQAKKAHGKKSAEARAARKVARGIKKERTEFFAANPGFVPPPKAKKGRTHGMVRKEEAPKVDRTKGELHSTYIANEGVFRDKDGNPTPGPDAVATRSWAEVTTEDLIADIGRGVKGEHLNAVIAEFEKRCGDSWCAYNPTLWKELHAKVTTAAPVAPAPVAPAKGQLSALLLGVLAQGHVGTPSQIAALVKAEDFGTTITAKMAADALGRLAKAGKCRKAGAGKYAALGGAA